jgi:hypothetical protein
MRVGCGFLLFILIVFPLLLVFILLAGINTWVLDRGFYQEVLSQPGLYESALDEAVVNWSGAGLPEEFGDVPPEALNAGLREIITPEYLQSLSVSAVDQVFDVLEGRSQALTLSFDFEPVKAALQGDGAADFANAYVEALPTCRANQETLSAETGLPVCRPTEVSAQELASQVQAAVPAVAESLPGEFSADRFVKMPDVGSIRLQPGTLRTLMTSGLIILGIVAVLVWLIDGFIGATDTRSRLLWLGFTLLLPAGLVLLAGISLSAPSLETILQNNFVGSSGAQNPQVAASFAAAAVSASAPVRNGFLAAGGIPTLVAVVLLIFGLISRPSAKRKNAVQYVQAPRR